MGRTLTTTMGAAAVALAGCGGPVAEERGAAPPATGLTLVPTATGLAVEGSGGREIGFGRDRAGALQSALRVAGGRANPVDCAEAGRDGARLGGLVMVFEAGAFIGWSAGSAAAGARCSAV